MNESNSVTTLTTGTATNKMFYSPCGICGTANAPKMCGGHEVPPVQVPGFTTYTNVDPMERIAAAFERIACALEMLAAK